MIPWDLLQLLEWPNYRFEIAPLLLCWRGCLNQFKCRHRQRYLYLPVQRYLLKTPLECREMLTLDAFASLSGWRNGVIRPGFVINLFAFQGSQIWWFMSSERHPLTGRCWHIPLWSRELKRPQLGPNRNPWGYRAAPKRGEKMHHHAGETGHSLGCSRHSSGHSFQWISDPALRVLVKTFTLVLLKSVSHNHSKGSCCREMISVNTENPVWW